MDWWVETLKFTLLITDKYTFIPGLSRLVLQDSNKQLDILVVMLHFLMLNFITQIIVKHVYTKTVTLHIDHLL